MSLTLQVSNLLTDLVAQLHVLPVGRIRRRWRASLGQEKATVMMPHVLISVFFALETCSLFTGLSKQTAIDAVSVSIPPKAHTEADRQAPHVMPPTHRDIQAFSLTEDRLDIFGLAEEWELHIQHS